MKNLNLKSLWTKLKTLAPRKVITYSLILTLLAAGFFVAKVNTFNASSSLKTIVVSGNITDVYTSKPISGVDVTISSAVAKDTLVTKTSSSGYYEAIIIVDYSAPEYDFIMIDAQANDYPLFQPLLVSIVSLETVKQDILLSKSIPDIVTNKKLDPISAKCRTEKSSYSYFYHPGDYKGKIVDGVLFCTQEQNANWFDLYSYKINDAATQIQALKLKTSLSFVPTVYLTSSITWIKNAAAYAEYGKGIVIDVIALDVATISHEFGHLVDWDKGFDVSPTSFMCYSKAWQIMKHCPLSWRTDFLSAFVQMKKDTLIEGYATTNPIEAFAEFFAAQQTKDYITSSDYNTQERLKYAINNTLMAKYTVGMGPLNMGAITSINPDITRATVAQNTIMYIYKFVAAASNTDQYFSGSLGERVSGIQISNGDFMDKSVVSVKVVDRNSQSLGDMPVTVGNISGITSVKKDKNVFTNGTGDLFDTTGTLVLKEIEPGIVTIKLPNLSAGKTFSPKTVSLQKGANKVLTITVSDAPKINDPFTGTLINSKFWTNTEDTAIFNNKLRIVYASETPDSDLSSKFILSGDFDVQVSYSDLVFSGAYSETGLEVNGLASGSNLPFSILRGHTSLDYTLPADTDLLSTHFPSCYPGYPCPTYAVSTAIIDKSTSGIFRIKRTGSTGFVYKSDGTTLWTQRDIGTNDVTIDICGRSGNLGGSVQANFSDFMAYSDSVHFIQPQVTTLPPTSITEKTVVPNGIITDIGATSVTKRGFRLTKVPNTVQEDYSDTGSFGIGAFTKSNVTLSLPDTTYYIQAYATNSKGTTYGDWVSFKSLSITLVAPQVTTSAPATITSKSFTASGNISNIGGAPVTKRGFQVTRIKGTSQADYGDTGSFGTGDFSRINVNLAVPNATYYVRAYATNSAGTTYGGWVEFKSSSSISAPQVATLPVTSIGTNSASFYGNITSIGGAPVTKRGFQITRDKTKVQADYPATGGFGVGEFTKANISLYFSNSTYYVRAYATNSIGTAYGAWVEFKTLAK